MIIGAQFAVRDWPLPSAVKFGLVLVVAVTGFLLLAYQYLVRYTWLGPAAERAPGAAGGVAALRPGFRRPVAAGDGHPGQISRKAKARWDAVENTTSQRARSKQSGDAFAAAAPGDSSPLATCMGP